MPDRHDDVAERWTSKAENQRLERESSRKENALAEAAALATIH